MPTIDELRAQGAAKLEAQARRARKYQQYADGEPEVIAILEKDDREVFKRLLNESRANWCELVVTAVAERLHITGFDLGAPESEGRLWTIWEANQMDADSDLVHTDALTQSRAFVMVQPDEDNPTGVQITGESALEVAVLYQPGSRRRRRAAYKRWTEDGAGNFEVLITPEEIHTWEPGDERPRTERNPAGRVNVIEFQPQPRTVGPPQSELEDAIPFQDRINTTIFGRLVATDYGAFRQVWATGLKLQRRTVASSASPAVPVPSVSGPRAAERAPGAGPVPPAGGSQVVKPFNVGADRLLVNENPEGRFGSLAEGTLTGYLAATEQDVQHCAAITQTPPHYLLGALVNIGPEAIIAAETGLVSKVRRRSRYLGESWEDVARIALSLVGDPAAVEVGARTVWAGFETRSDAQLLDALVKAQSIGIPRRILWERFGATREQIPQWEAMALAEARQAAATQAITFGAGGGDPYAALLGG